MAHLLSHKVAYGMAPRPTRHTTAVEAIFKVTVSAIDFIFGHIARAVVL